MSLPNLAENALEARQLREGPGRHLRVSSSIAPDGRHCCLYCSSAPHSPGHYCVTGLDRHPCQLTAMNPPRCPTIWVQWGRRVQLQVSETNQAGPPPASQKSLVKTTRFRSPPLPPIPSFPPHNQNCKHPKTTKSHYQISDPVQFEQTSSRIQDAFGRR